MEPMEREAETFERLRALALDTMGLGVVIQSAAGAITYANGTAEEMLGIPRAELQGLTSSDRRWQAVDEHLRELPGEAHPAMVALRTGTPVRGFLIGVNRSDGSRRWFNVDAFPLVDGDGPPHGVATTFTDETEQLSLRAELEQMKRRFDIAERAGRVGLWEWHVPTDAVWHDEGFVEVTAGIVVDRPADWFPHIHADDVARVERTITETVERGRATDTTFRLLAPDGSIRWVVSHADVVEQGDDGRALLVAGSVVDATAMQAAEAHAAQLLDHMTDGYFTLTSDWRCTYVNEQGARILSRARHDLVGHNIWDVFPEAVGTAFEVEYGRSMAGESVSFEAWYDGLGAWFEVRSHPVPEGIAVYFRDITDRREAQAERERLLSEAEVARTRLLHAATHDPLTDLPNRAAIATWIGDRLATRPPGGADPQVSVLVVDLDRFKLVNDSHGHAEGDAMLVEAGHRLRELVRPGDLVARLGGDEFLIGLTGEASLDDEGVAARLVDAFREPFRVGNRLMVVSASVGIARASRNSTADSLVRDADAALYQAKDAGRDGLAVFDDAVRRQIWQRVTIEADLRDALAGGGIVAHYQPIFDVPGGAVSGVEALARWQHGGVRPLTPADFVPVAEETGLVVQLGEVMLEHAISSIPALDAHATTRGAVVWVNVSARQLEEPAAALAVIDRLREAGAVDRIGFEVTETVFTRNTETARAALDAFVAAGVPVAIDDFGVGYSSVARLAQFRAQLLKIDRSFVEGMDTEQGRRLVRATIDLAHAMGAEACAEGVETEEQLALLRELGVDKVSGYHLCRPASVDALGVGAEAGSRRSGSA